MQPHFPVTLSELPTGLVKSAIESPRLRGAVAQVSDTSVAITTPLTFLQFQELGGYLGADLAARRTLDQLPSLQTSIFAASSDDDLQAWVERTLYALDAYPLLIPVRMDEPDAAIQIAANTLDSSLRRRLQRAIVRAARAFDWTRTNAHASTTSAFLRLTGFLKLSELKHDLLLALRTAPWQVSARTGSAAADPADSLQSLAVRVLAGLVDGPDDLELLKQHLQYPAAAPACLSALLSSGGDAEIFLAACMSTGNHPGQITALCAAFVYTLRPKRLQSLKRALQTLIHDHAGDSSDIAVNILQRCQRGGIRTKLIESPYPYDAPFVLCLHSESREAEDVTIHIPPTHRLISRLVNIRYSALTELSLRSVVGAEGDSDTESEESLRV